MPVTIYNLENIIKGKNRTMPSYSNPVSSNPVLVTVLISGTKLTINKNALGITGTTNVTFDYTGSNGVTGIMTWIVTIN